jgi:hypothetical protein
MLELYRDKNIAELYLTQWEWKLIVSPLPSIRFLLHNIKKNYRIFLMVGTQFSVEEGSSYFCKFEIVLLALCVFGILIFGVMRFQCILGV